MEESHLAQIMTAVIYFLVSGFSLHSHFILASLNVFLPETA